MTRVRRYGLLLAAVLGLLACDSGGQRDVEGLSGTWRGVVDRQGTEYTVVVELRQTQTEQAPNPVEGTGQVSSSEESLSFSVDGGAYLPSANDVTLPLQYDAGRPGRLFGTVANDLESMDVTIIGGPLSFNGESFTLERDG